MSFPILLFFLLSSSRSEQVDLLLADQETIKATFLLMIKEYRNDESTLKILDIRRTIVLPHAEHPAKPITGPPLDVLTL